MTCKRYLIKFCPSCFSLISFYCFGCELFLALSYFLQDEFLLLCPAHSSVKFPKEKSGICAAKDITMPKQLYNFFVFLVLK